MFRGFNFLTMLVLLPAFYFYGEQNTKEQEFTLTVQEVIKGFSRQDSLQLSKYINEEVGIFQLDRIGAFDHYNSFKTVPFSDGTYPAILFQNSKSIKIFPLQFTNLPTYDCEKEIWSKRGLFVDTTKIDHLLSQICIERNKYQLDTISTKTIQSYFNLEKKSRRLVLYDGERELVFYLSYLNGKWYLTIIDTVTSDCSV